MGLPAEGLSRRRARKWFGGVWRHRLLFGRGMVSDDTDHAIMTAQLNLLRHPAVRSLWFEPKILFSLEQAFQG